jgi:hypothetical protein
LVLKANLNPSLPCRQADVMVEIWSRRHRRTHLRLPAQKRLIYQPDGHSHRRSSCDSGNDQAQRCDLRQLPRLPRGAPNVARLQAYALGPDIALRLPPSLDGVSP